MLFIMFDIEIIFLYPYAVAHEQLGAFGFGAIMFFSVVFFLSFVYEVGKGGLDWGPVAQARRLSEAVSAERTMLTTVRRVGLEGREEAA
jgi:NADH-quinone oxidoreductase subunit A